MCVVMLLVGQSGRAYLLISKVMMDEMPTDDFSLCGISKHFVSVGRDITGVCLTLTKIK